MHATTQLPHSAVVGGLPPASLLGFAGSASATGVPPHLAPPPPHPAAVAAAVQAQTLLKPSDLQQQQQHRSSSVATPEDRKSITMSDDRLRRSVSPQDKFRTRTPDIEPDTKRRKDDKLGHVSIV